MKVKMVKMGSDDPTPINCRIRGIVVTEDNKHLFVELGCGYRPDIRHVSLNQKEYYIKYPNEQYVCVDSCYRVDIPEDHFKNNSKEYRDFIKENRLKIPYTKEGIIKVLQELNPNIEDIELVNEHYIEKYCEENGFFPLYDNRLKHENHITEIKCMNINKNGEMYFKYKYTCYAVDGTEYKEIGDNKGRVQDIIEQYGKESVKPLMDIYVKELYNTFKKEKIKEDYNQLLKDLFDNDKADSIIELEDEYTDI